MEKKKYSEATIQAAINAVKKGISKRVASKKYGVPRATLQFRMSTKFNNNINRGPTTALTGEEESLLVKWVANCCKKGFPMRKDDIFNSVQEFLTLNNRENPFVNNYPGRGWYRAFSKRHPELAFRTPEAVASASSRVSENNIKNWLRESSQVSKKRGFLRSLSTLIECLMEMRQILYFVKNEEVLAPKGDRNNYDVEKGKSKSALTVMFSFSASGKMVPPMLIFPYTRLPNNIVNSVPNSWGIGRSDSGLMKSEVFYEYIANVLFYEYIVIEYMANEYIANHYLIENKVTLPVILFIDGHNTHLTYQLSQLCSELQIVLVALYPYSTRILQPADVAAFKPIKYGWRQGVKDWRTTHPNKAVTKEKFAPILSKIKESVKSDTIILNGFKSCGLFPWNSNAIDYSKCIRKNIPEVHGELFKESNIEKDERDKTGTITKASLEDIIGESMVSKFQNITSAVKNEQHCNEFFLLYRIYEEFERADTAKNTNTEEAPSIDELGGIEPLSNEDATKEQRITQILRNILAFLA